MQKSRTPRTMLVEKLGGRCEVCGYSRNPQVLQVCVNKDLEAHRTRMSRDAFYMWLLMSEVPSTPRLLCLNCKFDKMYEARAHTKQRRSYVWRTALPIEELTDTRLEWLDAHVNDGELVYVIHSTAGVFKYPDLRTPVLKTEEASKLGELPRGLEGYIKESQ